MLSVKLFLIPCAFVLCCGTAVYGVPDTLKFVNLIYRHGDRGPIFTYPTNPNTVADTWPQGLGWLTPEGMKMHYSLGRFLRRRYDGFINEKYKNTEIAVQSSDISRCLMSAYSNLAGLYPPSGDQEWNANLPWQPIPVHTRPIEEDRLLPMAEPCPMYDKLFKASVDSELEEGGNKEFYQYIERMTGKSGVNVGNIWGIADTFYCEQQHSVKWPEWMNDTTFNKLRELEAVGYTLEFEGKKSYFKGGPLLKDWIYWTQRKIHNSTYTTKLNVYSAHDSTVIAILSALRLHNHMSPPYTSTVFLELHQGSTGPYYVELYFRNMSTMDPDDDTPPYPLTLPGCEFQCPFDQFVELTKDAYPADWKSECSLETTTISKNTEMSTKPTTTSSSLGKPVSQTAKEHIDYKIAFIVAVAVYSAALLTLCAAVMVTCFRLRRGSEGKHPA